MPIEIKKAMFSVHSSGYLIEGYHAFAY